MYKRTSLRADLTVGGKLILISACVLITTGLLSGSTHLREPSSEPTTYFPHSIFLNSRSDSSAVDLTKEADAVTHTVTATVYHAVKWQCNSEYWITADMSEIDTLHPDRHRWCAVSRDLLKQGFSMGDTIRVEGTWVYDGLWIIHDKMNKRYEDRIDFLTHKEQARGKWNEVQIELVGTILSNS